MVHKVPGDEGHISSIDTLSQTPEGLLCFSVHRQHYDSYLYQLAGRSAFAPSVQVSLADSALDRDQVSLTEGKKGYVPKVPRMAGHSSHLPGLLSFAK